MVWDLQDLRQTQLMWVEKSNWTRIHLNSILDFKINKGTSIHICSKWLNNKGHSKWLNTHHITWLNPFQCNNFQHKAARLLFKHYMAIKRFVIHHHFKCKLKQVLKLPILWELAIKRRPHQVKKESLQFRKMNPIVMKKKAKMKYQTIHQVFRCLWLDSNTCLN